MTKSVLFTADLKKMRNGTSVTQAVCVTRCQALSARGTYGMVTPIFEEQYLPLGTSFTVPPDIAIWFGLLANESIIWNRNSPTQTVHSIARDPGSYYNSTLDNVVLWEIKSKKFELPVYYHYGNFAVTPARGKLKGKAVCICEKGEIFITSGGQTRQSQPSVSKVLSRPRSPGGWRPVDPASGEVLQLNDLTPVRVYYRAIYNDIFSLFHRSNDQTKKKPERLAVASYSRKDDNRRLRVEIGIRAIASEFTIACTIALASENGDSWQCE